MTGKSIDEKILTSKMKDVFAEIQLKNKLQIPHTTAFAKNLDKNPALNEAYNDVVKIRKRNSMESKIKGKEPWEIAYDRMVEATTTSDPELKDAWDKYYMIQQLSKDRNDN